MEKLEEYNLQNLTKRDTDNINSRTSQSVAAISKLIAAVQDLSNNVSLYKDCMVDYLNISTEVFCSRDNFSFIIFKASSLLILSRAIVVTEIKSKNSTLNNLFVFIVIYFFCF